MLYCYSICFKFDHIFTNISEYLQPIICVLLIGCKVTCHQKCYKKVDNKCSHDGTKPIVVPAGSAPPNNRVFAVPLENLVRPEERIPAVVDRLITTIELHGLYTEGLYRKSGASSKVSYLLYHL